MTKEPAAQVAHRYRLRVAAIILFCVTALAGAQCDLASDPITLSITGFGTAHFQEFVTVEAGSRAVLSGDVCIVGEGGAWTIIAEQATISGLRQGEQLRASIREPTLLLDGWRVTAIELEGDGEGLELSQVTFVGRGVMGSAGLLALDTQGGDPVASDVKVLGESFRLEARQARLTGNVVDLQTVVITTCTCPGEPFYTVSGGAGQLDLERRSLAVDDGRLEVAGAKLQLAERVELSGDALQNFSPPVTLEYRPGTTGTGLGVVVPDLELDEGLSLEMGILGLDSQNPLQGFALLRYREENISFTVGRARGGPRADFEIVEPLTPSLDASFAIHNRHEAASDYLHEGLLQLEATPPALELGAGWSLQWNARAFGAVSSQELAGAPAGKPVVSPRLGVAGGARLQLTPTAGSTLALALEGQATGYPALSASQYGVAVRPSWQYRRAPWTVDVAWNRLWTDSGSPFSTKLDRLTPSNRVSTRLAAAGALGGGANGSAQLDVAYDLRRWGGGNPGGLESLGARFGLGYTLGAWKLDLSTRVELAGLLDPDPAGKREGYFQTSVKGIQGEWEVGTRVRYELRPGDEGLSLLEASLALPLAFESGTLTPFLALDFVPLLQRSELPRVSGHGLDLAWASCCGIVRLGYRQHDGTFATSFGLALEH
ncbi:MAG: hypothetical protein WD273_08995 [Trueperaceae bacterium]